MGTWGLEEAPGAQGAPLVGALGHPSGAQVPLQHCHQVTQVLEGIMVALERGRGD